MVKMTKSGVVYDVKNSPFQVERNGYIFKFSSEPHRHKFIREAQKKEEWLNDSLSRRFRIQVDFILLADIQLYQQIEQRGFYIYDTINKEGYDDVCNLQYHGMLTKTECCETPLEDTIGELMLGLKI